MGGDLGLSVLSALSKSDIKLKLLGCDIVSHIPGRFFVDEFLVCPMASDHEAYTAFLSKNIKNKNNFNIVIIIYFLIRCIININYKTINIFLVDNKNKVQLF